MKRVIMTTMLAFSPLLVFKGANAQNIKIVPQIENSQSVEKKFKISLTKVLGFAIDKKARILVYQHDFIKDTKNTTDAILIVEDGMTCGSGGCLSYIYNGTNKQLYPMVNSLTVDGPAEYVLPDSKKFGDYGAFLQDGVKQELVVHVSDFDTIDANDKFLETFEAGVGCFYEAKKKNYLYTDLSTTGFKLAGENIFVKGTPEPNLKVQKFINTERDVELTKKITPKGLLFSVKATNVAFEKLLQEKCVD